jgi:hypothetical protein
MRRRRDVTEGVTAGPQLNHTWARLDRPGAQLRAGKVHGDEAAAPRINTGVPDVFRHGAPRGGVIVHAVDARHVHAALHQATNQIRVRRGL